MLATTLRNKGRIQKSLHVLPEPGVDSKELYITSMSKRGDSLAASFFPQVRRDTKRNQGHLYKGIRTRQCSKEESPVRGTNLLSQQRRFGSHQQSIDFADHQPNMFAALVKESNLQKMDISLREMCDGDFEQESGSQLSRIVSQNRFYYLEKSPKNSPGQFFPTLKESRRLSTQKLNKLLRSPSNHQSSGSYQQFKDFQRIHNEEEEEEHPSFERDQMIKSGLFEVPVNETRTNDESPIRQQISSLEEVLEKERLKHAAAYPSMSQGINLGSTRRQKNSFRKSIPARPFDKSFPAFSPIYNRQKDNLRERQFMQQSTVNFSKKGKLPIPPVAPVEPVRSFKSFIAPQSFKRKSQLREMIPDQTLPPGSQAKQKELTETGTSPSLTSDAENSSQTRRLNMSSFNHNNVSSFLMKNDDKFSSPFMQSQNEAKALENLKNLTQSQFEMLGSQLNRQLPHHMLAKPNTDVKETASLLEQRITGFKQVANKQDLHILIHNSREDELRGLITTEGEEKPNPSDLQALNELDQELTDILQEENNQEKSIHRIKGRVKFYHDLNRRQGPYAVIDPTSKPNRQTLKLKRYNGIQQKYLRHKQQAGALTAAQRSPSPEELYQTSRNGNTERREIISELLELTKSTDKLVGRKIQERLDRLKSLGSQRSDSDLLSQPSFSKLGNKIKIDLSKLKIQKHHCQLNLKKQESGNSSAELFLTMAKRRAQLSRLSQEGETQLDDSLPITARMSRLSIGKNNSFNKPIDSGRITMLGENRRPFKGSPNGRQ